MNSGGFLVKHILFSSSDSIRSRLYRLEPKQQVRGSYGDDLKHDGGKVHEVLVAQPLHLRVEPAQEETGCLPEDSA